MSIHSIFVCQKLHIVNGNIGTELSASNTAQLLTKRFVLFILRVIFHMVCQHDWDAPAYGDDVAGLSYCFSLLFPNYTKEERQDLR